MNAGSTRYLLAIQTKQAKQCQCSLGTLWDACSLFAVLSILPQFAQSAYNSAI